MPLPHPFSQKKKQGNIAVIIHHQKRNGEKRKGGVGGWCKTESERDKKQKSIINHNEPPPPFKTPKNSCKDGEGETCGGSENLRDTVLRGKTSLTGPVHYIILKVIGTVKQRQHYI